MAAPRKYRIVICRGPECGDRRGSAALHEVFRVALETNQAREHTELVWQSCFGRCTQGPNVLVREILTTVPTIGSGFATAPGPRGTTALYNRTDAARAQRIVSQHVVGGQVVREYVERPEHGSGLTSGIATPDPLGSTAKDSEP